MYFKQNRPSNKSASDSSTTNQFAPRPFKVEDSPAQDIVQTENLDTQSQKRPPAPKYRDIPVFAPNHEQPERFAPRLQLKIDPNYQQDVYSDTLEQPFEQRILLQPKLTIGEPGDKYEVEADQIAKDVVQRINSPNNQVQQEKEESIETSGQGQNFLSRMSIERVPLQPVPVPPRLQMKLSIREPGEEQKPTLDHQQTTPAQPLIQRVNIGGMAASPDVEAGIQRARSGGQPLTDSIREPMEQAFGADFSGVRVHTDSQADQLNQSIQAKAFTTGQDVFFRQGAYEPGSRGGQELLAHELTHVVQQSSSTKTMPSASIIQRTPEDALKQANLIGQKQFKKIKEQWDQYNLSLTKYKENELAKAKFEEAERNYQKIPFGQRPKERPKATQFNYNSQFRPLTKPNLTINEENFIEYNNYNEFLEDDTERKKLYNSEDIALIKRLAELAKEYIDDEMMPIFYRPPIEMVKTEDEKEIKPQEILLNIPDIGKIQILLFKTVNEESEDNVLAWMSHGVWLRDKPEIDLEKEDKLDKEMGLSFAVKKGENLSFVNSDSVAKNASESLVKFKNQVNEDNEDNPYKTSKIPNMVLGAHEEWSNKDYEERAGKIVKTSIGIGSIAVLAGFVPSENYTLKLKNETENVFNNYILINDLLKILKGNNDLKQYKNLYMLTCRTDVLNKKLKKNQSIDNSEQMQPIPAKEASGYSDPITSNE
ncbi:DUF4157 domain-containing protein [Nostoc sp. FACHB-87]|uniref:eCIS core domain-containing protein n=1 Tax=Nostocaceae TaxID=1162 RepID=UPI0016862557|nr:MULTISPECIES: DUF4157 domain-containing protein [Nostocaceae]MBD2457284.1 DUF4157 domain-containing protein [Nostoc sp. FACHB-87]MBD2478353.1 DUF4157 domain-containing protein [Anabaena sp. FACHB-83]